MVQTDRQTDKATWWSITAFNSEIERMEDPKTYPPFVLKVYGGRETCPTSGTVHFQGAVQCRSQQRLSAFKKWLPTAHLEAARSDEALKKYAMKQETAVGDKVVRQSPRVYMSMADALTVIGGLCLDFTPNPDTWKQDVKDAYWNAVRQHLRQDKHDDISLFSQPQMIAAWSNTWQVWIERAIVLQARQSEGDSQELSDDDIDRLTCVSLDSARSRGLKKPDSQI